MYGSDRRALERFYLDLPSRLTSYGRDGKEEQFELMTRDVCAGGAYLNSGKPLPVGTKVKVDIVVAIVPVLEIGSSFSRVNVSGIVIRTEKDGMAVCFNHNYKISSLQDDEVTAIRKIPTRRITP